MGCYISKKKSYVVKHHGPLMNQINKCLFLCSYNNRLSKNLYKIIQWQNIDKYKHKYDIYDVIISSLDNYKTRKTKFINREFNKYIKYCDYAEEQCEIQEKLLLYIMQINTYADELNNIVETILTEPIPKHICSISINTIIVLPQFETKIKIETI